MSAARPGQPWGHALIQIAADQYEEWSYKTRQCSSGLRCPERDERMPSWRARTEPADGPLVLGGFPVLWGQYSYISGRLGNVTVRVFALCETCGKHFADRHGLEVPALDAPRVDADLDF